MKWTFLILRWLLAFLFLYAGIIKGSASAKFLVTLIPFMGLIGSWIGPVSVILPWMEVFGALSLLIGPKKIGPTLILLLSLVYIVALSWALMNGIIVACSCFGVDETPSAWKMEVSLMRDIAIAMAALALLFEKPLLRKFR
jgi:uncharacterized membrane protein YphA (DoxX/SURF4 family)